MPRADLTLCGAPCCAEIAPGVAVQIYPAEESQFPEAIPGPGDPYTLDGYKFLASVNGFCVKLTKENLCSIYNTRPAMCREHSCEKCHGCFEV